MEWAIYLGRNAWLAGDACDHAKTLSCAKAWAHVHGATHVSNGDKTWHYVKPAGKWLLA